MLSSKSSNDNLPEPSKSKNNNGDRDKLIVPDGINDINTPKDDDSPEKSSTLTPTQENSLAEKIKKTKLEAEEKVKKYTGIDFDIEPEEDTELMTFEGEQMYLVERILEHKPKTAGDHSKAKKYKILWEGYPDPSEHTWEPTSSIYETAKAVVDEYWEHYNKRKEIEKANLKKRKEAMKLAGVQKRKRFPDQIPDEQIDRLNDTLANYQKITNNWGPIGRYGSCIQVNHDSIMAQVNTLLRSPFFIELNEKLVKENNKNSKRLMQFLEQSKNNTKPHLQMGLLNAVFKVLKDHKNLLPVRGLRAELKDYLQKSAIEISADNGENKK